jgi:hypothetical protein
MSKVTKITSLSIRPEDKAVIAAWAEKKQRSFSYAIVQLALKALAAQDQKIA